MYAGVPTMLPVAVSRCLSSTSLEIPKSRIFVLPRLEMRMLSGLMSRCTTPRSCATPTADSSCCTRSTDTSTLKRPYSSSHDRIERPSTHSITMKRTGPSSSKSYTRTMPGWLSAATVAASRWKRWRKLASLEYCSASTLMATRLSSRGWVERYTTPMAPRPSSASIGYFPSCVVATSGSSVCRRDPGKLSERALVEHAQSQVEGNAPVGLVHDLADPQVAGEAAQDVRVLPAQPLLLGQPSDRVPDRVLGVLHQVGPKRRHRVVPLGVALWLQGRGGGDEVVAPRAHVAALDHSKSELKRRWAFDPRNADFA